MNLVKFLWGLFIVAAIVMGLAVSCSPKAADSTDVPRADERKAGEIRAGGSMEAKPAQHYELVLGIYPSSQGHGLSLRSYTAVIRVPLYAAEEQCLLVGEATQERFDAQRRTQDMDVLLMDYQCLPSEWKP